MNEQCNITDKFEEEEIEIIGNISFYCNIQFDNQEFLTVLMDPYHSFTNLLNDFVDQIERIQIGCRNVKLNPTPRVNIS